MKLSSVLLSVMVLAAMHFPAPIFGQNIGDRVRVTVARGTIIGKVTSMDPGRFELSLSHGASQSIIYSNIQKLERSLGKRTYKKRGFLIGAGVGVAAAIFIGSGGDSESDAFARDTGLDAIGAIVGILAIPVCGVGGLAIGGLVIGEKWETIPNPSISGHWHISPMIKTVSLGGKPRTILDARIRF